ncbi:MAG TPA: hypothetical protein VM578_10260 [Candidatus Saccharimonadales bacterium]|nr:hypothetical protein [Candidatus Saccharimonadales bacterium]
MDTNHDHVNGEERNPSVGYDKSDMGARGILIFFLVLAVFAVAIHFCVLGMYIGMTRFAEKHDPEMSPLAPKAVTPRSGILTNTANVNVQRFPEPRLQSEETADMTKMLLKETAALNAEPWQDQQGNVHLPIDQAIKIAATRLPTRTGGTAVSNYPGAGREYSEPLTPDTGEHQNESGHNMSENLLANQEPGK